MAASMAASNAASIGAPANWVTLRSTAVGMEYSAVDVSGQKTSVDMSGLSAMPSAPVRIGPELSTSSPPIEIQSPSTSFVKVVLESTRHAYFFATEYTMSPPSTAPVLALSGSPESVMYTNPALRSTTRSLRNEPLSDATDSGNEYVNETMVVFRSIATSLIEFGIAAAPATLPWSSTQRVFVASISNPSTD
eukprot:Amastigsp_a176316_18.p4 type:complete len:192 gc:universal Amastigsp_a176316_18:663-1238(+)